MSSFNSTLYALMTGDAARDIIPAPNSQAGKADVQKSRMGEKKTIEDKKRKHPRYPRYATEIGPLLRPWQFQSLTSQVRDRLQEVLVEWLPMEKLLSDLDIKTNG